MRMELKDIIPEDFLVSITNSLTYSTGLGTAFIDREGRHVGSQDSFCSFCSKMNSFPEGVCACEKSNLMALEETIRSGSPHIYICHAGLTSFVVPMMYEGEYLGAITAGQVFCDDPSGYKRYEVDPPVDLIQYDLKKLYPEIQTLSRLQIESAVIAFQCISNYIIQQIEYNKVQQELSESLTTRLRLENQLKIAEIDALQKQIMPHFLFNVLGGVVRLLESGQTEPAKSMLVSFTRMMRYTLTDSAVSVTLEKELGYIGNYLSIQKIRFGNRLNYSIDCSSRYNGILVPFFGIQPLVENALKHGVLSCKDGGNVSISCVVDKEGFVISVSDDGMGISADKLAEIRTLMSKDAGKRPVENVGIYNSSRRFYHMYEDSVRYELTSLPSEGTTVRIVLSEPRYE